MVIVTLAKELMNRIERNDRWEVFYSAIAEAENITHRDARVRATDLVFSIIIAVPTGITLLFFWYLFGSN